MDSRIVLALLACGVACVAADQGDGLTLVLGAKPEVVLSVVVQPELAGSLSADQIKDDIELLLRQNNVKIVARGAKETDSLRGVLAVTLSGTSITFSAGPIYAAVVKVAYAEWVPAHAVVIDCLLDHPNNNGTSQGLGAQINCMAPHEIITELWHVQDIFLLGSAKLGDLRGVAKDMAQKFVLEYIRANPPKK